MRLLWIDLETTGLDAREHRILELHIREAEFLRPFETRVLADRVLHHDGAGLSPFIQGMHTKNGLLAECARSNDSLEQADAALAERVPFVEDKEERPILAGSTVHFDLGFVRAHLPMFASRLSYRTYDVRAVALFCQSLGMEKPPKAEAHRAEPDILESIALGRACARWLGWRARQAGVIA